MEGLTIFLIVLLVSIWWILEGIVRMIHQWSLEHGTVAGRLAVVGYFIFLAPIFFFHALLKGLFGESCDEWDEYFEMEEAQKLIRI
jgi:hypothetical protein